MVEAFDPNHVDTLAQEAARLANESQPYELLLEKGFKNTFSPKWLFALRDLEPPKSSKQLGVGVLMTSTPSPPPTLPLQVSFIGLHIGKSCTRKGELHRTSWERRHFHCL